MYSKLLTAQGRTCWYLRRVLFIPVFNKTFKDIWSIVHVLRIFSQHPYESSFTFWLLNIFATDISNNSYTIMAPLRIFSKKIFHQDLHFSFNQKHPRCKCNVILQGRTMSRDRLALQNLLEFQQSQNPYPFQEIVEACLQWH